jgi:hypothetical protein
MAAIIAQDIHSKLTKSATSDQQVVSAFSRIIGRQPDQSELDLLTRIAGQYSLAVVCRILFNSNEFMFVD